MTKNEQIFAAIAIAWVAYMAGKKHAAATTAAAPAVPADPLAWLNFGQL